MRVLKNLEPQDVFYYFEEISKIPHGSGNTGKISDYLVKFAGERNLEHYQDEYGNVIIIKEASQGYSDHEPVMLQGHMDMVAVKKPDASIDMKKEGLRLKIDGDRLMAEDTSLGGDDGIAVVYGLALLDSNRYSHPKIELVITVDEEVGMNGARALDVSPLKAKRLVNLDSEEEGIFLFGCAGGARVNINYPYVQKKRRGFSFEINVCGLQGGHSGEEIHKERGNAICLMGRVLNKLLRKMDLCIADIEGGVADNAIPSSVKAHILVTGYENKNGRQKMQQGEFSEQECVALLKHTCDKLESELKQELADKDRGVRIEVSAMQVEEMDVIEEEEAGRLISLINTLPYGVQAMSSAMPGLVETSLNPGLLYMKDGIAGIGISVRSSLEGAKRALIGKLLSLAHLAGAETEVTGEYPGWTYRKESPLRDKMIEVYRELYHEEPVIKAIHAGVECGLLADKIPGLDCVSIGPNMKNIHTAEEELSISSTERVWKFLLKLLEAL